MVSFAAIFYYLLGGVTFLPLCIASVLVYFVFLAPIDGPSLDAQRREAAAQLRDAEGDDLSVEAKAAALALASNNDQAQQKLQEANLTSRPTSRDKNAIPGAARRLGTQAALPKVYHSGWLVVRRQFEPTTEVNQHAQPANQNDKSPSDSSSSRDGAQDSLKPSSAAATAATATTAQAPGQKRGYMSAMYRNIMDYRASRAPKKGQQTPTSRDAASNPGSAVPSREPSPSNLPASKDSYYAIIKGPVLFLYSDDLNGPTTECLAAIDLRGKRVSMYISGGLGDVEGEPDQHGSGASSRNETKTAGDLWTKAKRSVVIKDGELFQKRNAIRIISPATTASSRQSPAEWFVFLRSSTSLEDWYHALVHASLVPLDSSATEVDPIGPVFVPEDMQSLLDSLDTIPDPIPLRWLNAMVGRIFYSIYRTAWIEDYVTRKLMKKIARVKTPGFLSDIRVREVHLGSTPPAFSRPMLKSLTGDGEASMEVAMHYTGAIRLTISTVLTISLGSRFKPYNVPLVLAVVLTSLEGNLLLQIKPPPSNRIWYGFTQLPKMEIEVEPVVSERKVQWAMVKRLIEGRIRELIAESVTVPNMDDLPFFDSSTQHRRGGIWAEAAVRQEQNGQTTASTTATEPIIPPKEDETTEAVSSATPAVSNPAAALRNRKAAQVASSSSFSASMPSISTSSAGAEGKLSDVLARSAKLNGAKSSGGASSPERKKSMISSLVGAGHRSTTSLHRSKGPQSSLAWGSASVVGRGGEQASAVGPISSSAPEAPVPIEREERTAPAAAEGPALSASQPNSDAVRAHDFVASPVDIPAIVAASLSHDRSRGSISSVATAATDDSTQTADTDLVNAALEESMRVSHRGSNDGEEQTTQHVRTSTTASPSLPPADGDDLETPHAMTQDFETPILEVGAIEETSQPQEGESTAIDPIRKAASTSELETAGSLELAGKSEEITGSNFMMPPPPPPRRTASPDVASIRTMDSTGSGGEVARPAYAFRPPPQRKVSGVSNRDGTGAAYTARTPSSSSVAADSLHRTISRDSLRSAATSPTTNTTQANILAGWTKAKAAMADKESRQATAGQAKEAASRAWSSWKAKRADTKQQSGFHPFEEPQDPSAYRSGVQQEWDQLAAAAGGRTDRPSRPGAGYQAYQPGYQPPVAPATSRPSSAKDPSPAASSWSLGTGSTDPTSLGAGFGFEMSPHGSPEWQRGWKAGQQAEGSNRPARSGTTSSRGADESTTASREGHEVSGYREYRAGRSREHSRVSSPGPGVAERDVFGDKDSPLALPPPLATSPSNSSSSKSGVRVQSDDSNNLGNFIRSNSSSSVAAATTPPPEGSTAGGSGFSFLPPAAKPVAGLSGGTTENDVITATTTSPQAKAKGQSPAASSPPLASTSVNRSPSSGASAVPPTRIRSQPGQTAMMAIPGMQRKSIGSSAAIAPAAADPATIDDATEGTDKGSAQST